MSSSHITNEINVFESLQGQLEAARNAYLDRMDVEKQKKIDEFTARRAKGLKTTDDRIAEMHNTYTSARQESRLLARDVAKEKQKTLLQSRVWYLDMMDAEFEQMMKEHALEVRKKLSPVEESIVEIDGVLASLYRDLMNAINTETAPDFEGIRV